MVSKVVRPKTRRLVEEMVSETSRFVCVCVYGLLAIDQVVGACVVCLQLTRSWVRVGFLGGYIFFGNGFIEMRVPFLFLSVGKRKEQVLKGLSFV